MHCGSIRQTASILSMSQECLRTGDKAIVHFRFIKNPEYLNLNQRLVFREGRTKAVGNVSKIIPMPPTLGSGHGAKGKAIKNVPRNSLHNQNQMANENTIPSTASGNGNLSTTGRKEESMETVSSSSKRDSLENEGVTLNTQLMQQPASQGGVGQGQRRNGKRGGRRKHGATQGTSATGSIMPLADSNM